MDNCTAYMYISPGGKRYIDIAGQDINKQCEI